MPYFEYAKWDGSQKFRPLSADDAFDTLAEYLLQHGDYILRQIERPDERNADVLKLLIKEGYLERDEEGNLRIGPRGVRRIETQALEELFNIQRKDGIGKHATEHKGVGQVRHNDSKPYVYGDPVANLNLHETLKNTVVRQARGHVGQDSTPVGFRQERSPVLRVEEEDFVVYDTEYQTSCATVVLVDMSG